MSQKAKVEKAEAEATVETEIDSNRLPTGPAPRQWRGGSADGWPERNHA